MDNGEIIQVGNIFPDTDSFKNRTAGRVYSIEGLAPTVRTPSGGGIIPQIVIDMETDKTICLNSKVDVEGCSTAITTSFLPSIAEPQVLTPKRTEFGKAVRKAYEKGELNMSRHDMTTMEPRSDGVSNTLTSVQKDNYLAIPEAKDIRYRIRKLSPRECFRLMGVDDADIDTIQASGISNSQQYKMAGNSIVVDTLYHLFRKMFCETENESVQPTLF